eukprot:Gb_08190 [translate_table: standard]
MQQNNKNYTRYSCFQNISWKTLAKFRCEIDPICKT